MYLTFRVTIKSLSPSIINDILLFIQTYDKSDVKRFFVVKENLDSNTHYQMLLEIEEGNSLPRSLKDKFVRKFRERFPDLKGNKFYSCKQVTDEMGMLRYLCKADGEKYTVQVVANNILSNSEILRYHADYYEVQRNLKVDKRDTKYKAIMDVVVPSSVPPYLMLRYKIVRYYYNEGLMIPDKHMLDRMENTYNLRSAKPDNLDKAIIAFIEK